MGPHSVREYAASVRPHYRLASRQEKGRLLDEFCRVTERDRKVVIRLLRRRPKRARGRTGRPRTYDSTTLRAPLEQVWEASDYLCSKRLAPFLPELVEALERHDELRLSVEQRTALVQISPATIDRLLRSVRRLHQRHGVATTSPSIAAVRAQVPVRTFGEWDNVAPGNVQADLLAHCGTSTTASSSPRSSRSTWPRAGSSCRPCGARASNGSGAPCTTSANCSRCRC